MRAKRRVTTARDARPGGIQRGPTPRRKSGSAAGTAPAVARPTGPKPATIEPGSRHAAPAPAPTVDVDLSVDLGRGLVLANPILVASGTFGYGIEYGDVVEVDRLGAICCKGTTLKPRVGNITPRVTETPGGMLNSIGLQNPGVDAVIEKYAPTWTGWKTAVIVNVAGESVADYVEVVRRLEGVPGVAGIELNISCPNVGRGGLQFAIDAGAAGEVTAAVRRATDLPLLVKLSPNVADVRPIARAIADAGADALTAINTLSGIAVAPSRQKPLLGNIYGGLSGPAIKP
ncbi:MAG TPA: dihydroorotate dehydrogenase, partial [Verrucomicrobiae bacterium]|nr:dihydroorotate dehydrogenase [Verrucomicrobiae bacterium]